MKQTTNNVDDDDFYKRAHAFSVYLRAQVNLINNMGVSKDPKDTTQWITFGSLLKWILQNRWRIC